MLFHIQRSGGDIQRALREATTRQRPADLVSLFLAHGERAYALALSDLSGRTISCALSVLSARDRQAVMRHLPKAARERLHEVDNGPRIALGPVSLTLPLSFLR